MRWLKILGRVSIVISSLLVFLILLEVFLRMHGFFYPSATSRTNLFLLQEDPLVGVSLRPNVSLRFRAREFDVGYNINSFGLRDKEFNLQKEGGTVRILMLGDSYTEGWGVEVGEVFAKVFERLLNEQGAKKYEVINAGMRGHSPVKEYLYLRERGIKFDPDVVILNYNPTDAFDDLVYIRSAVFENNTLVGIKEWLPGLNISVANSFYAVRFFERRIKNVYNKILQRRQLNLFLNELDPSDIGDLRKDEDVIFRAETDEEALRMMNLSMEFVLKTDAFLAERNKTFVLNLIPDVQQLDSAGTIWGADPMINRSYWPRRDLRLMNSFALEQNIRVVNVLPYLEREKENVLYYPIDGHLTKEGHKIIGGIIFEELKDEV